MNKKSVISVMVVAMLLTVSLYFVGGTYARYIDKFEGTASAKIAKWSVKLNESESKDASTVLTGLEWILDPNQYVAEGVIAPDSSMSAEVKLDLAGTQVAVDVFGSVNTEGLTDIIGTSNITVKMTVDGKDVNAAAQTEPTIAVGAIEGSHTVKITVSWENDEAQNANDTNLGKTVTKLDLPVSLTVQQHIAAE